MTVDLFKELLPAIKQTKTEVIKEENAGDYVPYVVNTGLSVHLDTVFYANDMNINPAIPNLQQFRYLMGTIRSYKRSNEPWPRKHRAEDIQAVMRFFDISYYKAIEAKKCLTEEQITEIVALFKD